MDSTRDLSGFVFRQYVYKASVFSTWHAINLKLYVKTAGEGVQGFICLFYLCFFFRNRVEEVGFAVPMVNGEAKLRGLVWSRSWDQEGYEQDQS